MDRHCLSFTARNSLVAITVLKRDPGNGLFVPVEILVLEKAQNDGMEVISTLLSCLITGINKNKK